MPHLLRKTSVYAPQLLEMRFITLKSIVVYFCLSSKPKLNTSWTEAARASRLRAILGR
jgi:hypothetical protein